MSRKIAMIGAGSVVFCKTLMSDILATPALADSEFALMSPTESKLRRMEAFANRMIADNNLPAKAWATTNREDAIRDVDFVVVMIQVGGFHAYGVDYEIPLKYGVDQCIGDTLGPGGVFRGQRHIPVLVDIAKDMERLAKPGAVMLQYANPMAANCLALGRVSNVPFVGLCHGVQTTLDLVAGYCNVPKAEIDFTCGGINHMDWFLTLSHKGRDLYPELRDMFERPEYYKNEKVRGEVFRQYLTEAAVIGLVGAGVGIALTLGALAFIRDFNPGIAQLTHLDVPMLAIAVVVSVLAAIVAGLLPTWRACQVVPALQLKSQ